ncbi:hypothetical protein THAOC_09709, partial [Thalassiosira oceanica]
LATKRGTASVDLSKGFVNEEHTTFALWRATEKGSDDMRGRDENGRHYLGRMGIRGELKTKGDDGDGNSLLYFCKIGGIVDYELGDTLENLSIKMIRLILAASLPAFHVSPASFFCTRALLPAER